MNAVRRESSYEVRMGNADATDTKIEALRDSLEETKADVRELRKDVGFVREKVEDLRAEMNTGFTALRGEMYNGFAALRGEMNDGFAALRGEMNNGFAAFRGEMNSLRESIADLRATVRTMVWGVGIMISLSLGFLTAGKALHWF